MHRHVHTGLRQLYGDQRLGHVLHRVGRTHLEWTHRTRQHDGHARVGTVCDALSGSMQGVGAVDDHHSVVLLGHHPCGLRDQLVVRIRHGGAVLVHERNARQLHTVEHQARKHEVEIGHLVDQDAFEFVVSLLDRSARGDQGHAKTPHVRRIP